MISNLSYLWACRGYHKQGAKLLWLILVALFCRIVSRET